MRSGVPDPAFTHVEPTICAVATPIGGAVAIVRLSGPRAHDIAAAAGFSGRTDLQPLPYRTLVSHAPRTATGYDLVELLLPGSAAVVEWVIAQLLTAGAEPACPGAFTRQALATKRIRLDQAQAVLALVHAHDAPAAARAVQRLRGGLGAEVAAVRDDLLRMRALVESGLDFLDEADVRTYEPAQMATQLQAADARLARWHVAAASHDSEPLVALVGPANAGKSALFNALTGGRALVAPIAGTTRDPLRGKCVIADRTVMVMDTAGWLPAARRAAHDLDSQALARSAALVDNADLILACSAPDARLPDHALAALPVERTLVVATKVDRSEMPDTRAEVLTHRGDTAALRSLIGQRLATMPESDTHSQRRLSQAREHLARAHVARDDTLRADDLRRACDELSDLLGQTTADDVLDSIFARFCIGK